MSASEDALVHCPAIDNALAEVVWGVLAAADVDENPSVVAHTVVRNIHTHVAGIAAAVEALLRDAEDEAEYDGVDFEAQSIDYSDLRAAFTQTGVADALHRVKRQQYQLGQLAGLDAAERNDGTLTPQAGAADALAARDARVLRDAADAVKEYAENTYWRDDSAFHSSQKWALSDTAYTLLRERADRIEAEAGGDDYA
ncbi:MAG: hypothetical protein ACRDQA_02830 [Nocardioidaceae bacterium]